MPTGEAKCLANQIPTTAHKEKQAYFFLKVQNINQSRLLLAALRVFYLFLCSIKFQGILKLEKVK